MPVVWLQVTPHPWLQNFVWPEVSQAYLLATSSEWAPQLLKVSVIESLKTVSGLLPVWFLITLKVCGIFSIFLEYICMKYSGLWWDSFTKRWNIWLWHHWMHVLQIIFQSQWRRLECFPRPQTKTSRNTAEKCFSSAEDRSGGKRDWRKRK